MELKEFLREIDSLPLAMSYVPDQRWRKVYAPDVGFERGTVFAELDLPFIGKREGAR